jgi:putative DNA primase/helicase
MSCLTIRDNPTIVFGSWKTDQTIKKSFKNLQDLSPHERQQYRQQVVQARQAAEQERKKLQLEAALEAQAIWKESPPAPHDHPYLTRKNIQPCGARVSNEKLVLSVYDEARVIANLQFIGKDGTKRFLSDGAKTGNCFTIGEPGHTIYVVEGFATGATIYEVIDTYVVIAFDVGNLKPVALRLRREYPDAQIIIAADNDAATDGNPGLTKAKKAAQAVDGLVVFPTFKNTDTNGKSPTDFNDLYILEGLERVREQLHPASTINSDEWPEPIPLEDQRLPELPTDLFPPWMGNVVNAVARATETPSELAATLGLAALATACQRTFEVEPEPGYVEPVNIWGIAAMESGNRKTAVLNAMTAPLRDYEREQTDQLIPERTRIESERKTKESRIQHLRSQAAKANSVDVIKEIDELEASLPNVPTIPQLWAQDVTPEKLGQMMADQGGVLALISDEGGIFETVGGRYNKGIPNLDLLLQSHSGSPVRIHRASREPIDMAHPVLTMGLSPQPDVLRGLVQKPGFRGRGLLARFLYTLPPSRLGYRSLESSPISLGVKESYRQALHSLLAMKASQSETNSPERFQLQLCKDAHREWKEFSRIVEDHLRDGNRFEHIRDWAAKLPGVAARVAGLLHCATYVNAQPWSIPIELTTMENTLTLMAVLAGHALRAFEVMAANPDLEKAKKILAWVQRKEITTFTQRDCHHELQGTFPRIEDLKPGLKVLEERYILRQANVPQTGPGRPSIAYNVHPQLIREQLV